MPVSSVDLWLVDLDACAPALAAIEQDAPRLSPADRARAARFADPREATRRLAAYIALRLAIERLAGPGAGSRPFVRGAAGKPVLPQSGVAFSLAHAEDVALIGVTRLGAIGIDIEKMRPVSMSRHHVDAICAAGAGLSGAPLPDPGSERAFLQAWTRLEAYTKARGLAQAQTLAEAGVRGSDKAQPAEIGVRAGRMAADAGLSVCDVRLPPGLYGAVATTQPLPEACATGLPADRLAIERILAAGSDSAPG